MLSTSAAQPGESPSFAWQRFLRVVAVFLTFTGFFSGAAVKPAVAELTQPELEMKLASPSDPLGAFVSKFEHDLKTGDLDAAEAVIERDAILQRATRGTHFDGVATVRKIFGDSTRKAWDERGVTRDYAGTNFRFLRVRTLHDRAGLLFRSTNRRGGLNYALFVLHERPRGQYRVADIFVVGLNEFISDSLRRTWTSVAASFLGEDARELPGVNLDYVRNIGEVAQLSKLLAQRKYAEVLEAAHALPASVQRERSVMLVRMEAAEHTSVEERSAVFADWLSVFPDEGDLPLKLTDYYVSQRRWDDAARILRGLMDRLGPDMRLKMELGTVLHRKETDWISAAGLSGTSPAADAGSVSAER